MVVLAEPASAHADFVSAVPRAGSGIPQAPGDVVLRFSEPLIPELSDVRVEDSAGAEVTDGPTRPVPGDDRAMQRSLGLLEPGQYTVRWTTTSPLDGHTLRGSYMFGIGVMTLGNERTAASPVDSEGWLGLASRWVLLAGLGGWAGVVAFGRSAAWSSLPQRRRRRIAGTVAMAVVSGGILALAASAVNATGGLDGLPALITSQSGALRTALPILGVVGAVTAGRAVADVGWFIIYATAGGAALLLEAGSGHAASSAVPAAAVPLFAVHLAAAGVWITAVVLALASDTPTRKALRPLARPALTAAALTGVTGVLATTIVIQALTDLTTTAYGNTLVVKIVVVVVMAAFGWVHRSRRQAPEDGILRRPLWAELATGLVVLAVATALVGFPNPPAERVEGQRRGGGDALLTTVAARPAVSLAHVDGPFVIGLTLAPPEPGPVEVRVQMEGVEPGDGLRDVQLRLHGPSGMAGTAELSECGFGCFAGRVDLDTQGTWELEVHARSNRQPIRAAFSIPLPTPDGTPAFDRMMAAMEAARSAVVTEDLRATEHDDPITSQYTFSAPDRMRWEVGDTSVRIAIGRGGYTGRAGDFEAYDWVGDGFNWPDGFYESFFADTTAMRLLGREELEGEAADVLAFVQPDLPAWFRVWLDPETGGMRRLQMLTDGHLMLQDYTAYDESVTVQAPPPQSITGRR